MSTKKFKLFPSVLGSSLLGLALMMSSSLALSTDKQAGSRGQRTDASQPSFMLAEEAQDQSPQAVLNRRGQRNPEPVSMKDDVAGLIADSTTPDRRGQRTD